MDGPEAVVNLPDADPRRLAEAVRAALAKRGDVATDLQAGASRTMEGDALDDAARRFQLFLELGYLVASADGFAEEERSSLAHLLEQVTASAVDHTVLELHFSDLAEGVEQMGRRERLARAAAEAGDRRIHGAPRPRSTSRPDAPGRGAPRRRGRCEHPRDPAAARRRSTARSSTTVPVCAERRRTCSTSTTKTNPDRRRAR
jgi:hypothetical protein